MRILYNNRVDDFTLTPSTEDPNFVASELSDTRLANTWRTTAITAQTIVIDAAVAISCDSIAIAAHNFTASATIKIQAATADSWGAPPLDETITYRSGIMVLYFTSSSYRYWRFYFDDTTNTNSYLEVGRLFLGEYLQFDPSSIYEFPEERARDDVTQFSPGNQMYVDKGVQYKRYKYSFPATGDTMKASMDAVYTEVGKFKPFFFMNFDTTYTVIEPIYAVLENNLTWNKIQVNKWDYSLIVREVG